MLSPEMLESFHMWISRWGDFLLACVIASAAVAQAHFAKRLWHLQKTVDEVRILLRFTQDEENIVRRLSLRVANLSGVGVFVERVECSIEAVYRDSGDGDNKFKGEAIWNPRTVIPGFGVQVFDIHRRVADEVLGGRNADFSCDLMARAIYIDHGQARASAPERVTVRIHQQMLMELSTASYR
jgi:hypothetical protein